MLESRGAAAYCCYTRPWWASDSRACSTADAKCRLMRSASASPTSAALILPPAYERSASIDREAEALTEAAAAAAAASMMRRRRACGGGGEHAGTVQRRPLHPAGTAAANGDSISECGRRCVHCADGMQVVACRRHGGLSPKRSSWQQENVSVLGELVPPLCLEIFETFCCV